MAFWFFFLVLLVMAVLSTLLDGQQQPSTDGFISIDCGSHTNYTDSTTNITYVSDDQFTDTGTIYSIPIPSSSAQQFLTLRSFPNASRSCYVVKPVAKQNKYLVRAIFNYGNYDGNNSANIMFDLYIDVNFWETVKIDYPRGLYWKEAIVVASADSISVCLVNTGLGTPFMSVLELRPIPDSMYPAVNSTLFLVPWFRYDVGPSPTTSDIIRYPADPYDRFWVPGTDPNQWTEISTTKTIDVGSDAPFQPPMVVMQTAATPTNSSVMEFSWSAGDYQAPTNEFYFNMFFAEVQANSTSRTFNVYLNGDLLANVTPPYLSVYVYTTGPLDPSSQYRCVWNSTGLSTLPPILNAMEAFTAIHLTHVATDARDVDAINAIKKQYEVKRSWMGDPCAPRGYAWDGLNCSYVSNPPRIINVSLSTSALTGVISPSFANLTEVKYLDLSYNNLTGSIPDALGTLSSLQVLDLSYNNLTGSIPDALGTLSSLQVLNLAGNNLTGTIPDSLLKRSQQGSLRFRCDGNPYLCPDGTSREPKPKKIGTAIIVILCVVPVVLVLLLVVVFILWRVRKSQGSTPHTYPRPGIDKFPKPVTGHRDNLLQLENRQFTYKELEKITNKFTNVLGKGGFGTVFLGYLEDGTPVAVKMRSQSSSQGTKEFLAEAQNLTKIHHKNLVSLVGYCLDRDHLALVSEFMSQGTLQDHLRGKTSSTSALSWGQRLRIAIDAAQGLEYLHKGCRPPLIHRDVKSSNILLSESLEAKIADFGLSRAFDNNNHSHVSTSVVGTPGYLDPEYYSSFQLSEKSDVYSFGVVLLELITGQPAVIVADSQSISLVQWARQSLGNGIIEDVVDAKLLQKGYNVNSIWKATNVALRCVTQATRRRPTMTDIMMELKESLALENASEFPSTSNENQYTETTTATTSSTRASGAFEVEDFPSTLSAR